MKMPTGGDRGHGSLGPEHRIEDDDQRAVAEETFALFGSRAGDVNSGGSHVCVARL